MLVEMELREILTSGGHTAVVLEETAPARRQFPIYIGLFEAQALEMAVHQARAPRPLTHDLILNVFEGLGASLRRVIVDKIVGELSATFHGKLDLQRADHSTVWIDTRPSDALVLAVKLGVPLYVDEEVLEKIDAQPRPEGFEHPEDDFGDADAPEDED